MTASEMGLVREYLVLLCEWSEVAGSEAHQHHCRDDLGADANEPDQICQGPGGGRAEADVLLPRRDDGLSSTAGDAHFNKRYSRNSQQEQT